MAKKSEPRSGGKMASRATAADLLTRAAAAVKPAERRRLRAQAEALAKDGHVWCSIAEAHAHDGDVEGARRCADRALAVADGEVWVFRNVASLHAQRLGDPGSARRVLEACSRVLGARPETPGYAWRLLAEGYNEILADRQEVLASLAKGLARARSVDDLCSIAQGYAEEAEAREAALELLERAEGQARAQADASSWWTLANTYKGPLGDDVSARRMLERGREACSSVADLVTMASAFASHDSEPREIGACLEAAERAASSAEEWVDVAEGYHEHLSDRDAVRRCLARALSAAGRDDEGARRRVADGLRRWLGEVDQADRVSASGLRPSAIVGPLLRRLPGLQPEPDALFDWLRARLDDASVRHIARADHGSDEREHLAALLEIRDQGLVPHPLAWHPREVLELTRWSEGERASHLERAFCCAVLCIDDAGPRCEREGGPESSLAPLVESCQVLGREALSGLVGLTSAMADVMDTRPGGQVGELFARLALLLALSSLDPLDQRLAPGAEELVELERRCLGEARGYDNPDHGWLFGLTFFDQRVELWRSLLAEQAARSPAMKRLARLT